MGVITRGSNPDFMWPGIKSSFGMSYNLYMNGAQWKQIFTQGASDKAYEKLVAMNGFGLVPEKSEGEATVFDTMRQGYETIITNHTYSSGFIVTLEEIEDNQYPQIAKQRPASLAKVFAVSKEIRCANVLNRAFNNAYPGGDGVSLCNENHPLQGGLLSNVAVQPADLSEHALEQALIDISNFVDFRGNRIAVQPRKLVVKYENNFEAKRILGNPDRPGTADRDINAMVHLNSLPEGYVVNHYLDDPDAWFILTDCDVGLLMLQRTAMTFAPDNDYDTDNKKYKGRERFGLGWGDFKVIYGNPGA